MLLVKKFFPSKYAAKPGHDNLVKLFTGFFSSDTGIFPEVKKCLEKKFGTVDLESPAIDFHHTEYYEKEFGKKLKRIFFSFSELQPLEKIYKAKLITGEIEKKFCDAGRRRVNLDPGYIDMAKLVLFTTKDYSHRLYLGENIYGEVTLKFEKGVFAAWPWTYPDYKTREYTDFFMKVRGIYHEALKKKRSRTGI